MGIRVCPLQLCLNLYMLLCSLLIDEHAKFGSIACPQDLPRILFIRAHHSYIISTLIPLPLNPFTEHQHTIRHCLPCLLPLLMRFGKRLQQEFPHCYTAIFEVLRPRKDLDLPGRER